jgi:hypothetical protein
VGVLVLTSWGVFPRMRGQAVRDAAARAASVVTRKGGETGRLNGGRARRAPAHGYPRKGEGLGGAEAAVRVRAGEQMRQTVGAGVGIVIGGAGGRADHVGNAVEHVGVARLGRGEERID